MVQAFSECEGRMCDTGGCFRDEEDMFRLRLRRSKAKQSRDQRVVRGRSGVLLAADFLPPSKMSPRKMKFLAIPIFLEI